MNIISESHQIFLATDLPNLIVSSFNQSEVHANIKIDSLKRYSDDKFDKTFQILNGGF